MFPTAYRAVAICGAIVSIGTMGNVRGQSPTTLGDQFRNVLFHRSTDRVEQIRETHGTRIPTAFGFVPGHYYTSNYDSRAINEYDGTRTLVGTLELSSALGQNVRGLAFGADGLLYATLARGIDGFAVLALRSDGSIAASYIGSYYVAGYAFFGKIALDNQYLYVCGGALARFRLGEPSSGTTIYSQGAICDVKPLPNSNLFVASTDSVDEITNSGEFVRRIQLTGGQYFTDIHGIEYNPESNMLFVTHLGHTNFFDRIMRVNAASGALLNSAIFSYPDDIFLDRSGNLIVGSTERPPAFYSQDLVSLGNLSVDNRQNFVTQYAPIGATPSPTPAAQALNLSTRMLVQTGDHVGIGGFIITGTGSKHLLLRGIGPSAGSLSDPVLELHGSAGFVTITNDNWRDDPEQEALIIASGLAPSDNRESAIAATLSPGAYTAVIRGKNDATGIGLVEFYDRDLKLHSPKLGNISTRAFVGTGNGIVIGGFILGNVGGGTSNGRIIVRGIGPSLAAVGVPNSLTNPTLELRDFNGSLLAANNDWQDDPTQAAQLTSAGLALTNDLESGMAETLGPGLYTALLSGVNNGIGVGLIEVYDVNE